MGRKKSNGEPKEKKTPVKIRPIQRKHAGKITEPWTIMERLIAEVPHFAHLKVAKIKLWWQKDWRADVDGIATGAQVCKASELDRNIAEDAGAETPDVFIKLPEAQWPVLDDAEKEHRLFHELCHIKPAKDANGNQKRDSKDRLLWRLGRHPITAFHEEIARYGVERVIGHNQKIMESITYADRPMEKLFDEIEAKDAAKKSAKGDWRSLPLADLRLPAKVEDVILNADLTTIGALSDFMQGHGEFWVKDIKGLGKKNGDVVCGAYTVFWNAHPECLQA